MTTATELYEAGARPTGTDVAILASALLALAAWDDDYTDEQRTLLLEGMLPRTDAAARLEEYTAIANDLRVARALEFDADLEAILDQLAGAVPANRQEAVARAEIWRGEATTKALNAAYHELVSLR